LLPLHGQVIGRIIVGGLLELLFLGHALVEGVLQLAHHLFQTLLVAGLSLLVVEELHDLSYKGLAHRELAVDVLFLVGQALGLVTGGGLLPLLGDLLLVLLEEQEALGVLLLIGHLVDLVQTVHLILLNGELDLAFLDFVVLVLDILNLARLGLFELTPRFFDQTIVLDQLLLGEGNLSQEGLLLFLEVANVVLFALEELA